jgi:hypothetical protein
MSDILDAARARQEQVDHARRPIDYARMRRVSPGQKAALTRAVKTKDPVRVAAVCKAAVAEWNEIGAWPDDWSRWQRALDDVLGWGNGVSIEYL